MNELPGRLYKYVPAARIDILQNLNIRFTQPSALNDPFEFNLLFTESISTQELRNFYSTMDFDEVRKQAIEDLPDYQRAIFNNLPKESVNRFLETFLSNIIYSSELDKIHQQHIVTHTKKIKNYIWAAFNKTIGILSLTTDPASPPMWASYAENSKGFVIEFDTSNVFFHRRRSKSDEFYHLREVIYEDRAASGTMSETNSDIFVHKSRSWEYEKEWRILLPLETSESKFKTTDGDEIFLFDYPASAVTKIVFGLNTTEHTVKLIKQIVAQSEAYAHIEFSKITKGAIGLEVVPF